ncbi:MAG: permease-like cell division protein FtsX [Bacteroidales bacterium]|jgi:cell division transport system permease protein|nr:permease-like cell division protein FtsX [Bacteroidales bacterium]
MEDVSKTKSKVRGAYLTSLISVVFVLLIIGMIGLLLLNSKALSDYVKEHLCFSVLIRNHVKEPEIKAYQTKLNTYNFVNSTEFINSEEAAKSMQKELGEDFVEVLGYNPLPATINIYLASEYAVPDSIQRIKEILADDSDIVDEIAYQENLLHIIYKNIRRANILLLGLCALFIFISFALLNNTIRLQIYAKRDLIKTMKLIGAENRFIRRPFLLSGLSQGFWGSILAIIILSGVTYFVNSQLGDVIKFNPILIGELFATVLIVGLIFSYVCTFFSLNKYLKRSSENLIY